MNQLKDKIVLILFLIMPFAGAFSQDRFAILEAKLNQLGEENPGLYAKVDLSVNMASIQDFIRGIAVTDSLNVSVDPTINIQIINNFSNVMVKDVFMYLCKKYDLDISFTGSIMSFVKFAAPVKEVVYVPRQIIASYDSVNGFISMDLRNDSLSAVAKKLTEITGKNFVYSPDLSKKTLNGFIQQMSLTDAMDKLAFANSLKIESTDDNAFLIQKKDEPIVNNSGGNNGRPGISSGNMPDQSPPGLNIKKEENDLVAIDAHNASIQKVIESVSTTLKRNYYLLNDIKGYVTFNLKDATYEEVLSHLLNGTEYTYKNDNEIYVIGSRNQEGLRTTSLFQFKYRSVEKINDFIPADLKKDIDVKTFTDQNSLILCGSMPRIQELEKFLKDIDRVVPVILIEVLIVDVTKTNSLSTGIQMGLGTAPATTSGTTFPNLNMNLNASSINNIISGINGLGVLNLGQVTPNFYLNIQALDQQGVIKLRSTPKLTTLNGHEATMSIGSTQYYLETSNTVVGTQNPQNISTQQYKPVNADLSVKINPIVSGDEQITLSITVKQSEFTARISPTAPPGNTTTNFQSDIRVKNGDMVILGGLEESSINETGSGVPFLERIPIIKWFFSSRTRAKSKSKLTIFLRPTVIY